MGATSLAKVFTLPSTRSPVRAIMSAPSALVFATMAASWARLRGAPMWMSVIWAMRKPSRPAGRLGKRRVTRL